MAPTRVITILERGKKKAWRECPDNREAISPKMNDVPSWKKNISENDQSGTIRIANMGFVKYFLK